MGGGEREKYVAEEEEAGEYFKIPTEKLISNHPTCVSFLQLPECHTNPFQAAGVRDQQMMKGQSGNINGLGKSSPASYERIDYIPGMHVDDENSVVFLSVISA